MKMWGRREKKRRTEEGGAIEEEKLKRKRREKAECGKGCMKSKEVIGMSVYVLRS
jgi:hypothetical protein